MGNKSHKHNKREYPRCCNCIREEPKMHPLLYYNPQEPKCKIGVLGDAKTGKTCFCNRLAFNNYNDNYDETYVVSLISYKTTFKLDKMMVDIDIELNDNPSKEIMKSLIQIFIKTIQVAIILYAIDDRDSFEHLQKWVGLVQSVNKEIIIMIIGNKSDLYINEKVPEPEGKEFAFKNNYLFCLSSCLYSKDVEHDILEVLFVNSKHGQNN